MNFLKEALAFHYQVRLNRLSAKHISLWYALFHKANELCWPKKFSVTIEMLKADSGLCRSEIYDSRNKLKQLGLIDFENGKGGKVACVYKIIPSDIQMVEQTVNQLQPSAIQTVEQTVDRQLSRTLNKQNKNKNKQNIKESINIPKKNFSFSDEILNLKPLISNKNLDSEPLISSKNSNSKPFLEVSKNYESSLLANKKETISLNKSRFLANKTETINPIKPQFLPNQTEIPNPNKPRSSSNKTENNPTKPQTLPKHKFGEYKNVLLTDIELEKLNSEFKENTKKIISFLDEYLEMKDNRGYKSHYLVIKNWVAEAYFNKINGGKTYGNNWSNYGNYSQKPAYVEGKINKNGDPWVTEYPE